MTSSSALPVPAETAFFFDFDGTLCALAPTPDAVQVSPRVPVLLRALQAQSGGALAIVTGRPIADIDHFLAPLTLPIAGSHGAEFRDQQGRITRIGFNDPRLAQIAEKMHLFVADHPGLLLETKGAGLAVHYRAAPDLGAAVERAVEDAVLPFGDAFALQRGKMVVEIKPKGVDKGKAIERFMSEALFAGKQPLFAGDDLTDEKGFEVVNRLGGRSVKIGEGPTIAGDRLGDVEAFITWLETVAQS